MFDSAPKNDKQSKISELRTAILRAEKREDDGEIILLENELRAVEKGEEFDKEKFLSNKERSSVASQILKARRSESVANAESYIIHRTGRECLYRIGGLKYLFDYVKTLSSNKILDVGVGTGNAGRVISQMPISAGLDFEVTALRNVPELQQNFKKEKIHITAVETLRGVKDNSLAGIIGVNSIAYSDNPDLAIRRLDQVLVPGGVVKATFHPGNESKNFNGAIFKPPTDFIKSLYSLGYDISSVKENVFYNPDGRFLNSIILAIKPGNPSAPKAEELLRLDFGDIKTEAGDVLPDGSMVFDSLED